MALSQKNGYCYATNRYFANLYDVEIETISRWINHLKKLGYIESNITQNEDNSIDKRAIIPIVEKINTVLIETSIPPCENNQAPIDKKVKENNIKENNTRDNIYSDQNQKKFSKPTVEELKKYCEENSLKVDCDYFYDYYESNGWVVSKSKMKDWKATLRNWNRRNFANQKEVKSETLQEDENGYVKYGIDGGILWGYRADGKRFYIRKVEENDTTGNRE